MLYVILIGWIITVFVACFKAEEHKYELQKAQDYINFLKAEDDKFIRALLKDIKLLSNDRRVAVQALKDIHSQNNFDPNFKLWAKRYALEVLRVIDGGDNVG